MGVKTDRNGFLTEDGLVAFYRDFGRLGDDVEAAGVRISAREKNKLSVVWFDLVRFWFLAVVPTMVVVLGLVWFRFGFDVVWF